MTDNTELQRLIRLSRLSRLGRQIAARLPADLDHELHRYLRELPARAPSKPTSSKAVLRAQLEVAVANYQGWVTLCPPAPRDDELAIVDDDELDEDGMIGR